jgi:hypothetical protein
MRKSLLASPSSLRIACLADILETYATSLDTAGTSKPDLLCSTIFNEKHNTTQPPSAGKIFTLTVEHFALLGRREEGAKKMGTV